MTLMIGRNYGRSDRLQHRSDAERHRCRAIVRHAVAEGAERKQVEGGAAGRRERGRSELQGVRPADSLQRIAE